MTKEEFIKYWAPYNMAGPSHDRNFDDDLDELFEKFTNYLQLEISKYDTVEGNWFWEEKIQELTDEWLNL